MEDLTFTIDLSILFAWWAALMEHPPFYKTVDEMGNHHAHVNDAWVWLALAQIPFNVLLWARTLYRKKNDNVAYNDAACSLICGTMVGVIFPFSWPIYKIGSGIRDVSMCGFPIAGKVLYFILRPFLEVIFWLIRVG